MTPLLHWKRWPHCPHLGRARVFFFEKGNPPGWRGLWRLPRGWHSRCSLRVSQSAVLDSSHRVMSHTEFCFRSRFGTSAFGTVPGGPAAGRGKPRQGSKARCAAVHRSTPASPRGRSPRPINLHSKRQFLRSLRDRQAPSGTAPGLSAFAVGAPREFFAEKKGGPRSAENSGA